MARDASAGASRSLRGLALATLCAMARLAFGAEIDALWEYVDAATWSPSPTGGTDAAIDWNREGLALARVSNDDKAQCTYPAMLTNSAWDLHDMGRYAQALPLLEQVLAEWTCRSKPAQIHFARWSVARCLRSLAHLMDELSVQLALETGKRGAERRRRLRA